MYTILYNVEPVFLSAKFNNPVLNSKFYLQVAFYIAVRQACKMDNVINIVKGVAVLDLAKVFNSPTLCFWS